MNSRCLHLLGLSLSLVFLCVSAAAAERIRFASWNVGHFSNGVSGRSRITAERLPQSLEQFRATLKAADADVVGIAEYAPFFDADQKLPTPETLFGDFRHRILGYDNGHYNSLFIRGWDLVDSARVNYGTHHQLTHYTMARVRVGGRVVALAMTHLEANLAKNPKAREMRAAQMREVIAAMKDEPYAVVAGDFNVLDQDEFRPFLDAGFAAANHGTPTWPTPGAWKDAVPKEAIDNIFARGFAISDFRVLDSPMMADHCLVRCTLDFVEPAAAVRAKAERMIADGLACGIAVASNRRTPTVFGQQCRVVRQTPMTLDSRFDLASVTKTFTAVLCARLAAQGRLDVDAPFTKYLPEHVLAQEKCDITVRDLAMHVGGFASERAYEHTKSYEDCRRIALSYRPKRKRLEKFEYACLNYFYLGWIAENASGMTLDAAVGKYVFEPLGLSHTCWGPVKDDGTVVEIAVSPNPIGAISDYGAQSVAPHAVGNAGIFSTVGDMLVYVKALLGRKVFEPAAYDLIYTCRFDKDGERRSFGFDMGADDRPAGLSERTIWHTGWSGQTIAIDPEKGFCGVCLTGRSGKHGTSIRERSAMLSLLAQE